MWISVWTALVLAARSVLVEIIPTLALAFLGASGVAIVASVIGIFGIALFMPGGNRQDRWLRIASFCLAGAVATFAFLIMFGMVWSLIHR